MSITGGVFSETILKNAQIKADMIWKDRIQNEDYTADVGVLQALLANQTARITPIEGRKDLSVEISWVNACDVDDQACNPCVYSGTELSTNMDTKTLDTCRESVFYVNDADFRNNLMDPEDIIAKGYIATDKALSEYLAGLSVAWLNLNDGVNELGTMAQGTVVGNTTQIAPEHWDANLMAYFVQVAQRNHFNVPYLISGNQLFQQVWVAGKEYGNADGKGNVAKFGTFKTYFDLFNIDAANIGTGYITYLVNKGAFAMGNKTYYGPGITKYMDRWAWSRPSMFLPGISYDVEYKNECDTYTGSGPAAQTHYFKLTVNAGMFLNPLGCDSDRTGILSFICV